MSDLEVMSKEEKKQPRKELGATKVFIEEFKGNKIFAVFEVDDAGNKTKDKPEAGLGMRKAKVLMAHKQELQNWIDGVQAR